MRSERALAVTLFVILTLKAECYSQAVAANGETTSPSAYLQHAVRHLDQLSRLSDLAAPTPELRKLLDQKTMPQVRASFNIMNSNTTLPSEARDAAKALARAKHLDALSDIVSQDQTMSALSSKASRSGVPLESSVSVVDQVLTTELPAMSVRVIASGSSGLQNISQCMTNPGFYPRLRHEVSSDSVAIRRAADSVGRIEVRRNGATPTLEGTGFVINRSNGIIATACHVVNDIADYDASSRKWTVPAQALGGSVQILLDFGSTDAHDPRNEYRVTDVAFVPGTTGCDGALLKVDTATKPLPAELPIATSKPVVPLPGIIDVFSIGYPSRDLTGATAASRDYFTCIRNADTEAAKFTFGGEVTDFEAENGYTILTHIIPTVGGQSGSPVIQLLDNGDIQVIGIHICCTQSAQLDEGPQCEHRDEPFLQEAISIADLVSLAKQAGIQFVSRVSPTTKPVEAQVAPSRSTEPYSPLGRGGFGLCRDAEPGSTTGDPWTAASLLRSP